MYLLSDSPLKILAEKATGSPLSLFIGKVIININKIFKIKYKSMTIMAIGSLSNYAISSEFDKVYVKGQLIRLDTINDDFHVIDAIYQEVNKGFYVPQK